MTRRVVEFFQGLADVVALKPSPHTQAPSIPSMGPHGAILSATGSTQRPSSRDVRSPHQWRHLYARPSSYIYSSSVGTFQNPANSTHPINLTSYLETPWWGSGPPHIGKPSSECIGRDAFIYHTEKALDAARAAESTLRAAEVHLKSLILEEELNIQVLKDEIEDIQRRGQAARHQVAVLRATLQSEGVTPTPPPLFPFISIPDESPPTMDLTSELEEDVT